MSVEPSHYERGWPRAQLRQHSGGSQTQQFAQQLANSRAYQRGPAALLRTANGCSAVVVPQGTVPSNQWSNCPCHTIAADPDCAPEGGSIWAGLGPLTEAAGARLLACRRCALVEYVCYQGKETWEAVSTLHSIEDDKQDWLYLLQDPEASIVWTPNSAKGRAGSLLITVNPAKGCKVVQGIGASDIQWEAERGGVA